LSSTDEDDYRRYFGCSPRFAERTAGFMLRTADLARPLNDDQLAHQAVVRYLSTITQPDTSVAGSVRAMVRQLLPTGAVTLELIAAQLSLHPKALQRKLSHEALRSPDWLISIVATPPSTTCATRTSRCRT
jgi:AraC-like DNA-binding protein